MVAAPSRTLMEALWAARPLVRAYDPVAMDETRTSTASRPTCASASTVTRRYRRDALAIRTEWQVPQPDS